MSPISHMRSYPVQLFTDAVATFLARRTRLAASCRSGSCSVCNGWRGWLHVQGRKTVDPNYQLGPGLGGLLGTSPEHSLPRTPHSEARSSFTTYTFLNVLGCISPRTHLMRRVSLLLTKISPPRQTHARAVNAGTARARLESRLVSHLLSLLHLGSIVASLTMY
jgi:hypothetical protein